MNINEVIINAAFYEMFENVFGEDFFGILASMRPSPKTAKLKKIKPEDLTEEQKEELLNANLELAKTMKKYTSRIAYIGNKLYKKQYSGSYEDYLVFLASCDSSEFFDPNVIAAIWEKVTKDQNVPKSVKNA